MVAHTYARSWLQESTDLDDGTEYARSEAPGGIDLGDGARRRGSHERGIDLDYGWLA
jgi:hypothetical protein